VEKINGIADRSTSKSRVGALVQAMSERMDLKVSVALEYGPICSSICMLPKSSI
jgi:hypothetical protein